MIFFNYYYGSIFNIVLYNMIASPLCVDLTLNKNINWIKNWSNSANISLYKNMPLSFYKKEAKQGGIDNGCDVKAIAAYINKANSILEVGAGYGRVLFHITKSGYKKELYAIERSNRMCKFLMRKFSYVAKIVCADIRSLEIDRKFDLILWMWASICEFSKNEQLSALAQLTKHLQTDGHIIFDIIPFEDKIINAIEVDSRNKIIKTKFGNDYGYFPSPQELEHYRQLLNLELVEIIVYETKTSKKRHLHVLKLKH